MLFFKLGNLYCLINQLSWDFSPSSSEVLPLVITKIREIPYTLLTPEVMTHTNYRDTESKPSYEKISDSWTLKLLYQTILQSIYCLMWIVGFAFLIKVNISIWKEIWIPLNFIFGSIRLQTICAIQCPIFFGWGNQSCLPLFYFLFFVLHLLARLI